MYLTRKTAGDFSWQQSQLSISDSEDATAADVWLPNWIMSFKNLAINISKES
ncbi:hypothetical protein [Vibrio hippocampi]|uniref:Uncharacterized protein n=1 Tax=Vibrio hippocampi TaxID=654686 RepID=A0ABM8ZI97_9VIBR|nr:hypothetical protein [Vibrio hippocampi]CAH0526104.1 hypothetical protein VHP8226_01583 [Vibrio hippocampi]